MKMLRKWIALLLAMALVFDARVPVLAAGTGSTDTPIHYDEFVSGLEKRCEVDFSGATLMVKGQSVPLGKKGFISDNPTVVAVSGTKAVAKKSGTATLIDPNDSAVKKSFRVVEPVMSPKKKSLPLGDSFSLDLIDKNTKDSVAGMAYVSWVSSKPTVVSVDGDGNITALAKGSSTVSAYINGKKYNCSVSVSIPKGSKQQANVLFVNIGKTVKATAIKGTNAKSIINSLNTDIATVNKNVITGVYAGTAVINQDGFSYSVNVDYPTPVDDGEKLIKTVVKNKDTYLLKLYRGEIYNLSLPLVNQAVLWKSNNTKTVAVNEKGDLFAKKEGTAVLTAKVNKTTVKVNVEVNAKAIDEVMSADSDGDGLTDEVEKSIGTDPLLKDTDEDGLSDYEEVNVTQTNPLLNDTDSDGIPDGEDDEDGDSLTNRAEIDGKTNPLDTDSDHDGLDDNVELNTYGSNPLLADTDEDTIDDGKEVELGLNPVKAMTDGVTPDAERKFSQSVTNNTASELYEAASKAVPTVTGSFAGYASDHISISVIEKSELKDARFVVGEAYSVKTDYDSTAGLKLQFDCSENAASILDYTIGMFDADGEMKILEATVSGSMLSTDLIGNGDYFVMNLRAYLNSLGITVDTKPAPEPEPEEEPEPEGAVPDFDSAVPAADGQSNEVSEEWFKENYVLVDSEGRVVEGVEYDNAAADDIAVADGEEMSDAALTDDLYLDGSEDFKAPEEAAELAEVPEESEVSEDASEQPVKDETGVLRTGDALENGYHYVLKGSLDKQNVNSRIHYSPLGAVNDVDEDGVPSRDGDVPAQADIVFIVDTTGSMSDAISNVASNINTFVTELSTNYNVLCNFAFVDYRDITCGEETKMLKSKASGGNWFTDADEFKDAVSSVMVGGGGDWAETPFDGFGMADTLDFRIGASRFYILVTDADYKDDNNYGISGIEELTENLKETGTIASVISDTSYKDLYKSIYEETDGVFGDIYGDFAETLLALAGKIGAKLADGSWIVLRDSKYSRNYQIRCLKAPVVDGSDTDTDEDGIPDCEELTEKTKFDFITEIEMLLRRYGISDEVNPMDGLDAYLYKSDPTLKDTDFDGVDDKEDKKPRSNHFEGTLVYNKDNDSCKVDYNVDYSILLDKSNTDYHVDISVLASLLSADIYHENSHMETKTPVGDGVTSDMNNLLGDLYGMQDGKVIEVNPEGDSDDRTEFYVGHKEVSNNSKSREIILLVVRGTGKDQFGGGRDIEWSSNFDVGDSSNPNYAAMTGYHPDWKKKENHKGFDVAANNVLKLFKDYVADHGLTDKKKIVLITGHSRGAGIANIVGAYLENDVNYRSFTYTFAAPYTTTDDKAGDYRTIFNIVNKDDIVPFLPLEKWDFTKYGNTFSISVENDGLEDKDPWNNREGTFEWLTGKDYNNNSNVEKTLKKFLAVTNTRSGIYDYDYSDAGLQTGNDFTVELEADKYIKQLNDEYKKFGLDKFITFEKTHRSGLVFDHYTVKGHICPAFLMQDLANAAGGRYGESNWDKLTDGYLCKYLGISGNKYAEAKGAFIKTSVSGIEHPHLQPTYYLIAKYGIK